MSSALAPPAAPVAASSVAPPQCAPPAPSTPNATAPRKCGNCGTTESCKWRNVRSKDNIRCNTCYDYRRRTKKERSADVIQNYQWMKMVKSQ
ncbi:hypothetical protein CAEBREN_10845 [Caenorhabditis brenneri]|uniref:GATA-type domain-containing protein n=1 Tax=Caenorhabditis brenneri TaxID=135651 RepID=G0MMF2_CAEBE|nr:hypothetical protein CAEBREN_10845 [Caenorhabditis brenneri]